MKWFFRLLMIVPLVGAVVFVVELIDGFRSGRFWWEKMVLALLCVGFAWALYRISKGQLPRNTLRRGDKS